MKRDMDLIRKIMLLIESTSPGNHIDTESIHVEGYEPATITYHVGLLVDAGLVNADDAHDPGGDFWSINRLTWKGHEFIDSARSDSIWGRAKDIIKEKGGSIPFDVLQSLLTSITKGMLGIN